MQLFGMRSDKYLVVIKVVGEASYEQFMRGIGNNSGDDAYTNHEKRKQTNHKTNMSLQSTNDP